MSGINSAISNVMQNINQIISQAMGQVNLGAIPPHLINTSGPTPEQIAAARDRFNAQFQDRINQLF